MGIFKEFLRIYKEIKNNKFAYFFLFFQLVYFSGLVRQFGTDISLIFNILITGAVCFLHRKITNRDLNYGLIIFFVFMIITMIPSLQYGISPKLFLGYSGRIFLGIMIVVYYKDKFFDKFEKIVFFLAFISIFLFGIQIVYPTFFNNFTTFSKMVLSDERLLFGRYSLAGHRYLLIFLVNSWGEYRNSGFMWEPAAFGAVLSWCMLINIFKFNFKINPRLVVLFIAAITTFSIGTYIYLTIFAISYLFKNSLNKNSLYFLIFATIVISGTLLTPYGQKNLNMIINKIDSERATAEKIKIGQAPERVSRVGGFLANFDIILSESPFGLGVRYKVEDEFGLSTTPNGLMVIVRNWGVLGLFIVFWCSYTLLKKLKKINKTKISNTELFLFLSIIVLPLAGNPFYNQPFLFSVLLSGFLVPSYHISKNVFFQKANQETVA